jgi:hypothetical protein
MFDKNLIFSQLTANGKTAQNKSEPPAVAGGFSLDN